MLYESRETVTHLSNCRVAYSEQLVGWLAQLAERRSLAGELTLF